LGSYIQTGNLCVTTARRRTFWVGDGSGKRLSIHFTSTGAQRGVLFDPDLRFGEAYMDGKLQVEKGSYIGRAEARLRQVERRYRGPLRLAGE
jgi:cyclopropane-fatty-acyl-phospholipid synthase